jgi:hypothetical protein
MEIAIQLRLRKSTFTNGFNAEGEGSLALTSESPLSIGI